MTAKTTQPPRTKEKLPLISSLETEKGFYSNHIQVSLTNTEMIIDFFIVGPELALPSPGAYSHTQKGKFIHVHRAIAPLPLAKGLASAIANVVAEYEADHQETLSNSRLPLPEDKITIWPKK